MNEIGQKWEKLAEKQSWLRKSALQYFDALNADLSTAVVAGEIEYILKTWAWNENENAPTLARKITLDMIDGQITIHICKQNYDDQWDYEETKPDDLTIENLRLLAAKIPEILDFFEKKIVEKTGKIEEAARIFENYRKTV